MDHVPPDVFGEDYLYFYETWLDDELSDAQAELLWDALSRARNPGARRPVRARSDREPARGTRRPRHRSRRRRLLPRARASRRRGARCRGRLRRRRHARPALGRPVRRGQLVHVLRLLRRRGNRAWLETVRRTLKPGGRLAIDVHSRDVFMRNRMPAAVFERDGDLVVDRHSFDVTTGRETTERWLCAGGSCGRRATRCASTPSRSCVHCCSASASRPSRASATTGAADAREPQDDRHRDSLTRASSRRMRERLAEPGPVRRVVEPAACTGRVRQRDHDRVAQIVWQREALADRARQRRT